MNRHALDISKSQGIDFGMCARSSDEWVVLWNRSIGVDAHDLAHVAVELLWLRPIHRINAEARRNRRRDEQRSIGRLNHTAAGAFRIQQNLDIFDALVVL